MRVRICRQGNNPCLQRKKEKGETRIVRSFASLEFPSGKYRKSREYQKCIFSAFCREARRYIDIQEGRR